MKEQQDAYSRFQQEQERKTGQPQTNTYQSGAFKVLDDYQKLDQGIDRDDITTAVAYMYDNGKVSEGNIKAMQRVLGLKETGQWTGQEQQKAGNLNADDAWLSYQKGQLQNRTSHGQWEQGATKENIKTMERVMRLEEDGYWSAEDQKAAGRLSTYDAWKDYGQGDLQSRSKSGMSMEEWTELKRKQFQASSASDRKENTPVVQKFIAGMVTEDQASERGVNPTEWKMMVVDRMNTSNMTMDEFEQLERYYGLDISGGNSSISHSNTTNYSDEKISYAEYRRKTAAQKVSELNTAVQQYFNAYQAFANSAIYDIQHVDYNNATSMLNNRLPTAKELQKRAETLTSTLRMNGDLISGDYSELLDQIMSTKTGVDSIVDFYSSKAKYYSQWDSEEAFNEAAERSKQYYNNWGHYVNEDDFDYYSAKGAAIQNPTMDDAERNSRFLWWEWEGNDIGNIVTYSRENADMLAIAYANGQETKGNYKYRSLKDVEVDIYNYLLGKKWEDKANEFLSFMDEELNAREGNELAKRITGIDIPVVEELAVVLYGLGAGIDQWISGTRQLFSNELQSTTIEQYANSAIADSLEGSEKYVYAGANVIGNMAPSILLSYATAGLGAPAAVAQGVGAVAVGMSAAGNAYGSALRDGYSEDQARAYSTLIGVAEGTLQYVLGGVGSLGGVTDDLIKAKINMIDNSLFRISAKLGIDALAEISEEELQNCLEPAFRSIIFGEEYDAPTIDEMIETAILTAGTTILLGGSSTVSGDLSENRQLNVSVQMMNNQAASPINSEDVAKSLRNKGVSSKKVDSLAEAIVARLNGQELTSAQRSILNSELSSPTVQSVISEFMQKKADGVDNAQNYVYDNIKDNRNRYEGIDEDANLYQIQNTSLTETYENKPEIIDNIITDGSHLENGKLKPNVTYKTGEHDYLYMTNEDGLIVNVRTDDLQEKTHEGRLRHNSNTYGKEPGDHAGHLIADRFGGSPELDNLVSQAKNVNQCEFGELENQWVRA